jgi:hypothetical protein
MKLPKTFIPEKDLEEKTKQLLKESKKFKEETGNMSLYEELKSEFPNFTDYLFNSYSNLKTAKVKDKKGDIAWKFYIINQKATSAFLVCRIEPYIEERGTNTAEHGYNIKICIEKKWHSLKYRVGHYCFDVANTIVSTQNPLRYDQEKNIPFP